MGKPSTCWTIWLLALVCLATPANTIAQGSVAERFPCESDGQKLEGEELGKVLHDHEMWLNSRPNGVDVNESTKLCGADLREASLSGINLSRANLRNAKLRYADLSHTNLTNSDLRGASLRHANLLEADLTGADLTDANLNGAELIGAQLTRAILETDDLPDSGAFLRVRGLSKLQFKKRVSPAVELRYRFRESGFRSKEKEVTAALTKYRLNTAPIREQFFQAYIAGGRITDYGANPWGTLVWLSIFVFVFFFPYLLALRFHQKTNGIWRIRPADRVLKEDSEPDVELVPYRGFMHSIPWAFYFSILSAFHFGWRELNLGNWIIRLQFREYTLRATGWVRTVSGLQSLISLYLVALFLITYFGDPFA